jgi:hypothetical protein
VVNLAVSNFDHEAGVLLYKISNLERSHLISIVLGNFGVMHGVAPHKFISEFVEDLDCGEKLCAVIGTCCVEHHVESEGERFVIFDDQIIDDRGISEFRATSSNVRVVSSSIPARIRLGIPDCCVTNLKIGVHLIVRLVLS